MDSTARKQKRIAVAALAFVIVAALAGKASLVLTPPNSSRPAPTQRADDMAITLTLSGVAELSTWCDGSGDPNKTYTLVVDGVTWNALDPSPFVSLCGIIPGGAANTFRVRIFDGVSSYSGGDVAEQSAGVPANGVYPAPGGGGTWTVAGFGGAPSGGVTVLCAGGALGNRRAPKRIGLIPSIFLD